MNGIAPESLTIYQTARIWSIIRILFDYLTVQYGEEYLIKG